MGDAECSERGRKIKVQDPKQKSIKDFLASPKYHTPENPTPESPEGESHATPAHPQSRPEQLSSISSKIPPIIPVINLEKAFDSADHDLTPKPIYNSDSQDDLQFLLTS